jgi:hypothetical protein
MIQHPKVSNPGTLFLDGVCTLQGIYAIYIFSKLLAETDGGEMIKKAAALKFEGNKRNFKVSHLNA